MAMMDQPGSLVHVASDGVESDTPIHVTHETDVPRSLASKSSRYLFGLVLLGLVVCLWVGSSTLIQEIFVEMNFHQPFFLTFYSTSLFTLYLPIYLLRRSCSNGFLWCRSERSRMRRERVLIRNGSDADTMKPSPEINVIPTTNGIAQNSGMYQSGENSLNMDGFSPRRIIVQPNEVVEEPIVETEKMSYRNTAKLSLFLCPLWFLMNYFFNLSLNLTSIASSTILSTTSSLFVLIFSYFMDRTTTVRLQHVIGVCITILGVVLISYKDTDESPDDPSARQGSHSLAGDIVATAGALFYGLYTVLLKLRIPDDDKVEMTLVFGFIGLFNTLLFWPGFFVLNALNFESLARPPDNVLLALTLNGIFGTVISDFLWAKSVLLTSPLIASLGLALTIPLAIIVDWLLHDLQFTLLYFLGGVSVLIGFILVNVVHSKSLKAEEAASTASMVVSPRILDETDFDLSTLRLGAPSDGLSNDTLDSLSLAPSGDDNASDDMDHLDL